MSSNIRCSSASTCRSKASCPIRSHSIATSLASLSIATRRYDNMAERYARAPAGRRCPEQAKCTPGPLRSLYFPTRRLHELQTKNRADQQDANWRRIYGQRSGAEGTIEEFADGDHGRRCRYRGLAKTHVHHVLTALAINVKRLSLQEPADSSYPAPPSHNIPAVPRRTRLTPAAVVTPREVTPVLKIPDSRHSLSLSVTSPRRRIVTRSLDAT
ncbi:transposase [Streptomyces albidoflavus]